jgi:hypothetical protein
MGGGGCTSLVLPFIYVPLPSMYLNACLQYNKQSKEEKNKKRDMKRSKEEKNKKRDMKRRMKGATRRREKKRKKG